MAPSGRGAPIGKHDYSVRAWRYAAVEAMRPVAVIRLVRGAIIRIIADSWAVSPGRAGGNGAIRRTPLLRWLARAAPRRSPQLTILPRPPNPVCCTGLNRNARSGLPSLPRPVRNPPLSQACQRQRQPRLRRTHRLRPASDGIPMSSPTTQPRKNQWQHLSHRRRHR